MRELVAQYLSHSISRRRFVGGLTKAGLTATAAQSVLTAVTSVSYAQGAGPQPTPVPAAPAAGEASAPAATAVNGVKPFQGEDIPELMFKVANMPATPPSHLAPDLPPVVDYIIARALKKRPDDRYASAKDFAKDLRACLAEVAASAPNVVAAGAGGVAVSALTLVVLRTF